VSRSQEMREGKTEIELQKSELGSECGLVEEESEHWVVGGRVAK